MAAETGKAEQQQVAEADVDSFRRHLGPFVVAAETTRMPMVFTNAKETENPVVFANNAFLTLSGFTREEILGEDFSALMERGTGPKELQQVKAAFAGQDISDPEIKYRRKDGSEFWASLMISPVTDENGRLVQHFVSFVDLTEHKAEQTHAKLLIDELNHRVKNTLATVQSIVAQALRNSADPEVVGESIESRLFALSRSHNLLTREGWHSAGLLDIVKAAMEPFGVADGHRERFVITGPDVRFPPNAALALGIAFHELATNAVKYGAFSNKEGCVTIAWNVEPARDGERVVLCWREINGPPVAPPSRKGFGSRIIERGLAYELGGTVNLDYRPDGVVCTIDIPARRNARHE